MVVNGNEHNKKRTFQLAGMETNRINEFKCQRITLVDSGLWKAKREKATKPEQWWGSLAGMSRYRANKYKLMVFFERGDGS